jgi:aerobic carbon-monoxide dehydrogenase small subunit
LSPRGSRSPTPAHRGERRPEMAQKTHVSMTVNDRKKEGDVEPRILLVHFLRENLGMTGTHVGCDTTNCGACTVLMDGRAVKSCTVFAVQADGREVMTVEGMANEGELHPIQEAFLAKHGLQCGFCTPGMIMSAYALLEKNPHPTEGEIREGISGNICRCTGYAKIIESIQLASKERSSKRPRRKTR